ncbi:MAG: hypothetical protein WAO98_06290 [Alphaproteobacteria bacterium]
MTDAPEDTQDNRTGKEKSGKSGSGSVGGIRLPPNQLKEVMGDWEYLDASKIAARVAEFFSELPARASAHVKVSYANVQNQGFAIVTQLLKYAQEVSRLLHNLTRENADILRQRFGLIISGPSG